MAFWLNLAIETTRQWHSNTHFAYTNNNKSWNKSQQTKATTKRKIFWWRDDAQKNRAVRRPLKLVIWLYLEFLVSICALKVAKREKKNGNKLNMWWFVQIFIWNWRLYTFYLNSSLSTENFASLFINAHTQDWVFL